GKVLGTFAMYYTEPRTPTAADLERVTEAVYLAGVAIERSQAEQALRASEAQLAEALKTAQLAYWEYDFVNDVFTFNDQFYGLFRTSVEREGGYQMPSARYARQFVHPDDA